MAKRPKEPKDITTKENILQYIKVVAYDENISLAEAKKKVRKKFSIADSILGARQPKKKKVVKSTMAKKKVGKKGRLTKVRVSRKAHSVKAHSVKAHTRKAHSVMVTQRKKR